MRILFPTDFSETAQNAFQHALLLADNTDYTIVLLHVVPPIIDTVDLPGLASEVMMDQVETAKVVLEEFVENGLFKVSVKMKNAPRVISKVEIGIPSSIINKEIEKSDINLVVMGAKRAHNTIEKIFGTVSGGVVKRAKCPVMIIPEKAKPKSLKSIAYATDINESDPYEIWRAAQLLAPLNAIFRVVHVQEMEKAESDIEGLEKLESYFEDHPIGLQMKFHNVSGKNVEKMLNDFLYLHDTDLLVMYQPKRPFIEQLFHNSHTKKMAAVTDVPLLVMKPEVT